MAKLTANVVVAHPDTNEPVVLVEGSDLPDWAVELVGDHALDTPSEPDGDKPTGRRTAK